MRDAMLEKLESRYPIDLPAESWGRRKLFLLVMTGILGLFVLLPLAGAAYAGALDAPLAIAAAFGALVLVLLVAAVRGKTGHARK